MSGYFVQGLYYDQDSGLLFDTSSDRPAPWAMSGQQMPSVLSRPRPQLTTTLERSVGNRLADEAGEAANGYVYHETVVTEAPMIQCALNFMNNTAGTPSIDGIWVRTSDTYTADASATNASAWTALQIGGATINGGNMVTATARTSANRPSEVWTDLTNMPVPQARVDGGAGYVYQFRIHTLASATTFSRSSYDFTEWAPAAAAFPAGRNLRTRRVVAALANSLDASTTALSAAADLTHRLLMGWRYRTTKPGVVFGSFEDSVGEAAGYSGDGGYAWQLVSLLRTAFPNIPIELANYSWGSATTVESIARARDLLASTSLHRVTHALYCGWSSNDGTPSAAVQAASRRSLAEFLELCADKRVAVVLRTPVPNTVAGWTLAQDAFRLAIVNEILAMRQSGQSVIDANSVLSDGATPARYKTGLSTDGTHPNPVGTALVAAAGLLGVSALMPAAVI